MQKQVAIMGGGDWADASVSLLSVPENLDIEAAKEEYDEWREGKKHPEYMTFVEWLRAHKGATDSTVEEYWDVL